MGKMRILNAVVHPNVKFKPALLKRQALVFDKILVIDLDEYVHQTFPYDNWGPSDCGWQPGDIEYLATHGVLAEAVCGKNVQINIDPAMMLFGYPGPQHFEDVITRGVASALSNDEFESVPICSSSLPEQLPTSLVGPKSEIVLAVAQAALPFPSDRCPWQDILDFRVELRDKLWGFRRWLHSLATKNLTEAEIRDDIEWTLNEYANAMRMHRLKASVSLVDVFVVAPLEILENLVKFRWSAIAKGALSIQKRKVELMAAEMAAPGKECAYVFDAQRFFRSDSAP
jgi:hypothetical protein